MHLRFFVVLIAMLLQVQVSTAQRWDDNDMGAFFGIDVTKANLNWVDMNKLVDSYNRVLAGHYFGHALLGPLCPDHDAHQCAGLPALAKS